MRNTIVATLWVMTCILVLYSSARAEDISPQTIKTVQMAVVQIACWNNRTDSIIGTTGTAFFVTAQGDIVTPAHVLELAEGMSNSVTPCSPAILVPVGGWQARNVYGSLSIQPFAISNCKRDEDLDIAACQANAKDGNPFAQTKFRGTIAPVFFDTTTPAEGTAVAYSGFPLKSNIPVTSEGIVSGYGFDRGLEYLWLGVFAWKGASGSPAFVRSGRVIGMMTRAGSFDSDSMGMSFATPASVVSKFLSAHNITIEK